MTKYSFFIALSLLLYSCSNSKEVRLATEVAQTQDIISLTPKQLELAKLRIGAMTKNRVATQLKLSGSIDVPPQNLVSVSMPLGGYLKSTHLLPGMHVSKGEVIGIMEDQVYIQLQQEYLQARAQLLYASAELDRQKQLNATKASSDKALQQAQMDCDINRIQLKALSEKLKLVHINPATLNEDNLSKTVNIYSPINGFVSKVDVNIGKYVNPTDVLFELVNPSDIHLNLMVFEKDIMHLAIGQKVIAFTNQDPDNTHICEIILISKDLSPERTAEVHCHFEKYDKNLLPGMYMNAYIELDADQLNTLPEEAVVRFEGLNYVFVAESETNFRMVEVQLGNAENGFVGIKNYNDLTNKNIVIESAYTLLMALKNKEEE